MGHTILSTRLMAGKLSKFDEKYIQERIKQVTQRPDLWTEDTNHPLRSSQRSSQFGPWHYQKPMGENKS